VCGRERSKKDTAAELKSKWAEWCASGLRGRAKKKQDHQVSLWRCVCVRALLWDTTSGLVCGWVDGGRRSLRYTSNTWATPQFVGAVAQPNTHHTAAQTVILR
jgi:hypothetical protein